MNSKDFKEWLKSIGCYSAADGYYSHKKGYAIVVEKDNVIIKENMNYRTLHIGNFESSKSFLEGVL